ncbi:Mpv17/PMP22 family protein, partial [archaeon]
IMDKVPAPVLRALLRYLSALSLHPLRTKSVTASVCCAIEEAVAQAWQARTHAAQGSNVASALKRVAGMALYGGLVSGPLGHVAYAAVEALTVPASLAAPLFGRTPPPAWVRSALQLVAVYTIVLPLQNAVYLLCTGLLAGKSLREAVEDARARLGGILAATYASFPVVQALAMRYLPMSLWTPFFNVVGTLFSIVVNIRGKSGSDVGSVDAAPTGTQVGATLPALPHPLPTAGVADVVDSTSRVSPLAPVIGN